VVGPSLLAAVLSVCSCADSEKRPPADGGSAGAAAGTAGSSAGEGGAGGAAGSSSGGSHAGSSPEAGAGGAPPGGTFEAVLGEVCPLDDVIGQVVLRAHSLRAPELDVSASVWDARPPWIGEPELTTATCAYHHYTAGGCPTCSDGETCSVAGECVPERRTIKDVTLSVSSDGMEREYAANPKQGTIYSQLDIGTEASSFAMTLKWGDTEIVLAPMAIASGNLEDLVITVEGADQQPGALDATWTPSDEGAYVSSNIPINHHASGPTFTECGAPDSAGSFHADAAMIDPLAVSTGLEFQGVEHMFVAAAQTPRGCVDFRFGRQIMVLPTEN
jgi:hypothetical protein